MGFLCKSTDFVADSSFSSEMSVYKKYKLALGTTVLLCIIFQDGNTGISKRGVS